MGLADVHVEGITQVTTEELRGELAQGNTIKLVATAQREANGYRLSVRPTVVPRAQFPGSV